MSGGIVSPVFAGRDHRFFDKADPASLVSCAQGQLPPPGGKPVAGGRDCRRWCGTGRVYTGGRRLLSLCAFHAIRRAAA